METRLKLVVKHVTRPEEETENITMVGVSYLPSAELRFKITNPILFGKFRAGDSFDVDLSECLTYDEISPLERRIAYKVWDKNGEAFE